LFACHGPCKFCSGYLALFPLQYLPTDAIDIAPISAQQLQKKQVAKIDDLEKMPYAELADMEAPDRSAEDQKRNAERNAVRQRLVGLAKEHSLDTHDRFGKVSRAPWPSHIASQEPREHLDGTLRHAALDGCRDQGW
jgi:hypothetical protein